MPKVSWPPCMFLPDVFRLGQTSERAWPLVRGTGCLKRVWGNKWLAGLQFNCQSGPAISSVKLRQGSVSNSESQEFNDLSFHLALLPMCKIFGKPFHLTRHPFPSLESQMYILSLCFYCYLPLKLPQPMWSHAPNLLSCSPTPRRGSMLHLKRLIATRVSKELVVAETQSRWIWGGPGPKLTIRGCTAEILSARISPEWSLADWQMRGGTEHKAAAWAQLRSFLPLPFHSCVLQVRIGILIKTPY